MSKQVEFFYDFGSPASYLAYKAIPAVAERSGATIVYRPFLLGGVFKSTGNVSPVTVPAKREWLFQDFPRWAKRYGVPFVLNSAFPVNTLYLMRGACGAEGRDELVRYSDAMYDALWAQDQDLAQPEVVTRVLEAAGLDAGAYAEAMNDEAVKERLKANTAEAVERGAFGAPTFFVDGVLFFGQDRLDFVEEALAA
jgi:2-hydroxychromene-2-carboxylate isomerase